MAYTAAMAGRSNGLTLFIRRLAGEAVRGGRLRLVHHYRRGDRDGRWHHRDDRGCLVPLAPLARDRDHPEHPVHPAGLVWGGTGQSELVRPDPAFRRRRRRTRVRHRQIVPGLAHQVHPVLPEDALRHSVAQVDDLREVPRAAVGDLRDHLGVLEAPVDDLRGHPGDLADDLVHRVASVRLP